MIVGDGPTETALMGGTLCAGCRSITEEVVVGDFGDDLSTLDVGVWDRELNPEDGGEASVLDRPADRTKLNFDVFGLLSGGCILGFLSGGAGSDSDAAGSTPGVDRGGIV